MFHVAGEFHHVHGPRFDVSSGTWRTTPPAAATSAGRQHRSSSTSPVTTLSCPRRAADDGTRHRTPRPRLHSPRLPRNRPLVRRIRPSRVRSPGGGARLLANSPIRRNSVGTETERRRCNQPGSVTRFDPPQACGHHAGQRDPSHSRRTLCGLLSVTGLTRVRRAAPPIRPESCGKWASRSSPCRALHRCLRRRRTGRVRHRSRDAESDSPEIVAPSFRDCRADRARSSDTVLSIGPVVIP